ncbi:hypothetical protein COCNU_scaffold012715G000010 [Cocos nucifera]|nr:hypothetical protein [Cocos nucifera]
MTMMEKMSRLTGELKVVRDLVAHLWKRLHKNRKASMSGESEEMASLKRTVGELSKVVGLKQTMVQWLKLQLAYEHRAIEDAEVESEVLRRQRRELDATAMLAKEHYVHKRKGKVPGDSLKRAKVSASSSMAIAVTITTFKVAVSVEVLPTTKVGTVDVDSIPSTPLGPSSGDQALKLPAEGETREGKKKKKVVLKTPRKAHFSDPNDDSDERGEDPFDNSEIVQALTDKFAMLEVVDHIADLEPWQLVWGSLGTHLKSPNACPHQEGTLSRGGGRQGPRGSSSQVQSPSGKARVVVEPFEPTAEEPEPSEPLAELALESTATAGASSSPAVSPSKVGSF